MGPELNPIIEPPEPSGGNGADDGAEQVGSGQPRNTNVGRWLAAGTAVMVAIIVLGLLDRRVPDATDDVAQPPPTSRDAGPAARAAPVARTFDVPAGLQGSLFVLGEDESLTEIDLGSGNGRVAPLTFEVERWFVNQVSPLTDIVLVGTRRDLYAIDRATLNNQQHIADNVWVAAAPDGSWAALVPYGNNAAEIRLINGKGEPFGTGTVRLPAGAVVAGATDDFLVIDAAGSLSLLDPEGFARPTLNVLGRPVAVSSGGVARIVCTGATTCQLHAGPLTQLDTHRVADPNLAGPWYFGPAAVLSADGKRLVFVGRGASGSGSVRVELTDLASGTTVDSPAPLGRTGPMPALAFSPDGNVVFHISAGGVTSWHPGAGRLGANGVEVQELAFDAGVLALGVSDLPPPPPQPASSPPPSYT